MKALSTGIAENLVLLDTVYGLIQYMVWKNLPTRTGHRQNWFIVYFQKQKN